MIRIVGMVGLAWVVGTLTAAARLVPTDLRCEYLADPLGIDTREPQFSWKLVDSGQSRGQKQTAWQVVVEDEEDHGVLWDSGKVESGASAHIAYAGDRLVSNEVCRWKVRVWDRDGKPGAWSAPARFSMGLLEPAGWKAEWIRLEEADEVAHIWYRKTFKLREVPERAVAHLASIGYHELFVNGERIGTRVLSPAVSNLAKRCFYVSYDITSRLREGDNVVAVWTGPGWARADGSYGKGVWKQESIFKCQVDCRGGAGLHTDASWKGRVSSSENIGLWKGGGRGEYGGELIDARRHVPGWNTAGFDDSAWANATVYEKEIILSAEMLEPDRKVETLKPVAMTEHEGRYTFDLGRNFTGWLEFDLREGKEGQRVKFLTSNRREEILEFKQESHYIHDASGEGTFSHRFNYMAGRWVTVEGLNYEPSLEDLRCYVITNDRARTGEFACSNVLFNWIYETDLRTYLANTVNGVTMDCPHRERYGYGEVAFACAWGPGIPNYESAAYYRKVARDWFDVQREDGFVNTIAPQIYRGAGGTLWSSAPVTVSWELHRAFGDVRQLEEAYGPMKKWVDYLHGFVSEDGILTAYESASRFLGDWATPHGSEYGNVPAARLFNNCVYAYCLQVVAEAAEILGKPGDAKIYAERLGELRKSVHRQFYNGTTRTYIDGRQLSQVFPLFVGVTPERDRAGVMENLVREFAEKSYLDTGSSGLPILLKFMVEDAERCDLLFPALVRTEHPGYGYFWRQGETAWPEYWKISGIKSRIHTCYTGISGYFIRGVGGIRPDPAAWGMQKFVIKPQLVGDLRWANTSSASLYGRIVSNWERRGSTATFEVEVPVNTSAKVFIPAAKPEDVTESGKTIADAKGVRFLRMEDGRAVLAVQSGEYRFTSTSAPELPAP